jgi:hypothetical protein
MANILQPLRTESPLVTFGQTASALGAYESFRKMRDQRKHDTVVRELLGPAATGDAQALQVLRAVDPGAHYKLTESMRQHETGELQLEATKGAMSRADKLRQLRGLQNAFGNIQNVDPVNQQSYYDMLRARVETEGLLEPGTLQDQYTPEVAEDIRLQLQIGHDLMSDPIAIKNMTDAQKIAASAYGVNTPEFRKSMQLQGQIEQEALLAKRGKTPSRLPPGITLLRGVQGHEVPEDVRKLIRKRATSGVDVLKQLQDLRQHIAKVGWEVFKTKDAALGNQKSAQIQSKVRIAEEMGALDKDAAKLIGEIVDVDPTRFRQDVVEAKLDELSRTYRSQLASNLRILNAEVDLSKLTGGYLSGTSRQMLQEREMGVPYTQQPPAPDRQMTLREAAPFITREATRLREEGLDSGDARIAAAMRYGFGIDDKGKFFVLERAQKNGAKQGGNELRMQTPLQSVPVTPPVGSSSPRAETRDMAPIPEQAFTAEQRAARERLQSLLEQGSPQERYASEPNPLPPSPREPEKQNEYFSDMYAQGHDRALIAQHYMGVWGKDGKRRKPARVEPLPRLLTKAEQQEQAEWERRVAHLRKLSGEDRAKFLEEQRRQFIESGAAEQAAMQNRANQLRIEEARSRPPPMTREELRRAMIQRRQAAARRRYERKLERFEKSADRATRPLEGVMPPPVDQSMPPDTSVPRARRQ